MESNGLSNTLSQIGISSKYILRNTGEEVEVIAFNQAENGCRSEDDWVTYIDSEGKEHIKEHLSIQLDLQASSSMSKMFEKIFDVPKYEPMKFPSTQNVRVYEIVKQLVVERYYPVEEAVTKAKEIVDAVEELGI